MTTMPVASRREQRVIIQSTPSWPTSDADWITVPNYLPIEVSESLGNELGSCGFVQYLGNILPIGAKLYLPYQTAATAVADQAYVRVGVETSDGEIQAAGVDEYGNPANVRYSAIHYGRVFKRTFTASDTTGLKAGITTSGLGTIFDQIHLPYGIVVSGGTLPIEGWEFGPFNPCGIGNRSAAKIVDPVLGTKTYYIDPFSLIKWTAEDVAEMAIYVATLVQAVPVELDPASRAMLAYSDTWDFRGMSASQVLSSLANGRRGLNWKPVYVRDGIPRVRVVFDSVLSGTAITIPKSSDDVSGSDYVLKPATNQQELNLAPTIRMPQSADHRVSECVLTQDARAAYDEIILVAGHRDRTMSLEIRGDGTGQMIKGWNTSLESIWDAASNKELRASPKLDHVWRTFRFADAWDGKDRNGTEVTNLRVHASTDPFGTLGETGEFDQATFNPPAQGRTFQPLRMTGVWQGVDFASAITQATIDALSPADRQQPPFPPIICLFDGIGNYVPITGTSNDIAITVDPETGCLVLGSGPDDARVIKGWMDSGYRIVVTLAVRLPYPVRVSWRGAPIANRSITLRTSASESTLAPNTIMGMDGGTIQKNTSELYLERCVTRLRALLSLTKLWYASLDQTLTYRINGLVSPFADPAAPPPGTLITVAHLPQGDFTLNQVVTRREWNFTGQPSVTITTARCLPAIESFL